MSPDDAVDEAAEAGADNAADDSADAITDDAALAAIHRLLHIMRSLRAADGCPWDREQTFASIAPYTIEEAYEVADAIAGGDRAALADELGDLLLQVVYHAQMAAEEGSFTIADVASAICAKMERRHPHVFGGAPAIDLDEANRQWQAAKAAERRQTPGRSGVALALPALLRAQKLAARAGLPALPTDARPDLFRKELQGIGGASSPDERMERAGALLFSLARFLQQSGVDAEEALRRANRAFEAGAGSVGPDQAAG